MRRFDCQVDVQCGREMMECIHKKERKDPSPLLVEEQFSTHKLYAERETESDPKLRNQRRLGRL
jgi:hypothetical protein